MNKEKIMKVVIRILSFPIVLIGKGLLMLGWWILTKFDPNTEVKQL